MSYFVNKKRQEWKPSKVYTPVINEKKEENMDIFNDTNALEEIVSDVKKTNVKKVRKDKSLIEKTESSKTILTEDNKMLLMD